MLDHIPYSESYDLISSSPVLYQNKKHNLFVTKDELGEWVVSICDIKLQFRELERIFARKMLLVIAYVNIIRLGRSITRSYQSFKVTTVTKDVLLTVLGIAGDTTKILLGYKTNPSCFLVKVICTDKSMSISINYGYLEIINI